MKKKIALIVMTTVLAGLSSFWFHIQAQAQIDSFTFFIPFEANELSALFDEGYDTNVSLLDSITTTISIAIQIDNTQIIYDHWENGLEANLTSPAPATTFPATSGTEIWGDNNPTNGIPPGFAVDVLRAGNVITLTNLVQVPRDLVTQPDVYDGGDALTSIDGAVAVTLAVWPESYGTLYAGAWELYPTNRWDDLYQSPISPDLANLRPGFSVIGINVQAVLDFTEVTINYGPLCAPANVLLSKGQQFGVTATTPCGGLPVISTADGRPIQVHFFSANPGAMWEARGFTLLPRDDWSDDLLAPRSSDGDFWLYNPHGNDLPITVQSFTGTTAITIPALNTAKYPPTGLMNTATGLRFTSNTGQEFYGMAALDRADTQDWGYSLLAVEQLTAQTLIGWAPFNSNKPPGPPPSPPLPGSPVYVTAVTTTTVTVDFDNDPGTPNQPITILPLQEVAITDTLDYDMTGAFIYADLGESFLAVWGQDARAPAGTPSIDVGTNVVPLPAFGIRKVAGPIREDVDCNGVISVGDTFQYTVTYHNQGTEALTSVAVEDFLSPVVEYIPNSTEIISGPGLGPVPDDTGIGRTPFPLDEGGYIVGAIPFLESGSLIFAVKIIGDDPEIINTATVRSLDIDLNTVQAVTYTPQNRNIDPLYQIDKTLVAPTDGVASAGDLVTYTVTITNSSPVTVSNTITNFTLQDTYDANYLTFREAIPAPSLTSSGVITWSDITTLLDGELQPGATAHLTVTFEVTASPTTPITITNVASGLEPSRSDGTLLPTCHGRAPLRLGPPPLLNLQKTFQPLTNLSCTRSVNPGDMVQFRIDYESQSLNSVTNVKIEDNLPAGISYIPSSTRLNGLPIPDGGGVTPFPLDEGGYNVGDISAQQTGFLTFEAQVNDVSLGIRNQVQASSAGKPIGSDEVVVFNPATANAEPVLQVSIDLIEPSNGLAASGDLARFALRITNTSAATITTLHVEQTFDENYLTNPSPSLASSGGGVITWPDLTGEGNLPPGETLSLTVDFVVGPIPEGVTNTSTTVTVKKVVLSNGTIVHACQANANLGFRSPPDEPPPPPPPPPTQTPPPTPSPTPTASKLPAVLPETGYKPVTDDTLGFLIILSVVGLWVVWRISRRRRG